MNRRDFIKVTARGSAFAVASPMLFNLLAGDKVLATELSSLNDTGIEASLARVLKAALAKNKQAEKTSKKWAPSYRRNFIYWITSAKRAETRRKRIRETVKLAKEDNKSVMK